MDTTDKTNGRADDQAAPRTGTSALQNGIQVLKTFSREEPILGVTEISRRVGLHKSTVSRILATLEENAIVERHPTNGRFQLGVGVIELASPMLANLDVRRIARPFLEDLTQETGETSGLVVWNKGTAVVVEQAASPRRVKHTIPLGTQFQGHANASVRVFLSEASSEEIQQRIEQGFERYTGRTVVDPEEYSKDLQRVKKLGYAINDGETSLEEVGISAPVRDHRDRAVAAVLMAAARYRTPPETAEKLGPQVKQAAAEISARLGGTSD